MKKLFLLALVFISVHLYGVNQSVLDCKYIMDIPSLLTHSQFKDLIMVKDTLGEFTFYVKNPGDNNYRVGMVVFHVDSVIYEIRQTLRFWSETERLTTYKNSLDNSNNLMRDDGFFVKLKINDKSIRIRMVNYERRRKLIGK